MENKEVIGTHRMPDGTEYRVSIVPDQDAQEPYDDGQWPILRLERHRGQGTYVEPFNDAAKGFEDKFAALMVRSTGRLAPAELFERYLRIFHGVSQFRTYGPNQGTDYTYMAFDTKAWRESVGWTDERGGIAVMAEEKPLAEIQAYVEGDVWGWISEKRWNPDEDQEDDEGWEAIESVWGYYGKSHATAEAESNLGTLVENHKVVHRYPEHEKAAAVQSKIDAVMRFLEEVEQGAGEFGYSHVLAAAVGSSRYNGKHLEEVPPHKHQRIVFEHFNIDYAKIEAERELMIKRLQEDARE